MFRTLERKGSVRVQIIKNIMVKTILKNTIKKIKKSIMYTDE